MTKCSSASGRRPHAGATPAAAASEYFIGRFFNGFFRPKSGTIGMEFAGEVESAGATVTELAAGDRVFGIGSGTNAEYVCVREAGAIARIPDGMTFEEAAGIADGGLSAISLLRSADLEKGQRILVYGASGSIGIGAVQVAKHLGAHVTAVGSTKSLDVLRSLGADEVIDYQQEDFRRNGRTYDVILDSAGKTTFLHCRRSLEPDGIYVTTDPGFLWHDAAVSLTTKRAKLGIVRWTKPDLQDRRGADRSREVPGRDRPHYPLEDVVDAHRYVDTHQKVGNVVLTVR